MHLNDRFGASGSVLLTSSNEMEYAFEDEKIIGAATASVFTRILVEGLRTGAADANGDGYVDVDELYDYVRDRMIQRASGAATQQVGPGTFTQAVTALDLVGEWLRSSLQDLPGSGAPC